MSVKINLHFRVCVCLVGPSQTQTSQRKDRHMKRAIFFFQRNINGNLLFHIKQLQRKIIISKASKNEETGRHIRLAVGQV